MTNKEKFLTLVSTQKSDTLERNRERIRNRAMLRESQQIAIKVLMKLDDLGWSQKELAKRMEVSPQQITKIVSGKENLTLETQIKLQNILDIPVLASYYENKINTVQIWVATIEKRIEKISTPSYPQVGNYHELKTVKRKTSTYSPESYQQLAV